MNTCRFTAGTYGTVPNPPFVTDIDFEKFETQRSEPLANAENKVIETLIRNGRQIRKVKLVTTYRLPSIFCGPNRFFALGRDEGFELRFREGFIWVRPQDDERNAALAGSFFVLSVCFSLCFFWCFCPCCCCACLQ